MASATAVAAPSLLCPFDLSVDVIDRMLNFEIADDPTYTGFEVQAFDGDAHGNGTMVLLTRRADNRVDCYHSPGLRLDPNEYGIGSGLGEWVEAPISPARFEITEHGVDLHVGLHDVAGRRIDVRIDDHGGSRRRPATLLAPFGAGVEHPQSLMLVWMRRFDLARTTGRPPDISINGRQVRTGALPGRALHHRRLIKYAADLAVVRLNSRHRVRLADGAADVPQSVELDSTRTRIVAIEATEGGHVARLHLAPPLHRLEGLQPGAAAIGTWRLGIDTTDEIVGGHWTAVRHGDVVDLTLDVTGGWHPAHLPPLMRIVTTVAPVFRTWPTTYRWQGSVQLDGGATLRAQWLRTGDERGESYRQLTRTSTRGSE